MKGAFKVGVSLAKEKCVCTHRQAELTASEIHAVQTEGDLEIERLRIGAPKALSQI